MAVIRTGGVGRWTRTGLFAELLVLVVLALAATVLAIAAAEWPALRLRVDLTRAGANTLDPTTAAMVADLPVDVRIDVFFSPVPGDVGPAIEEVQQRTLDLLFVLRESAGPKIEISNLPVNRPALREERARELRLSRDNVLVVSAGPRRVALRVEADLASIALGDPRQGSAPSVVDFRAEEALVEALGRVADAREPRVLFSTGLGEPDPAAMALGEALAVEGFGVGTWSHERDGAVPAEAAVLAVLGLEQPFTAGAVEAIRGFVAGGGNLLVALGAQYLDGPGSPLDLLEPYGLRAVRGLVCTPLVDPRTGGPLEGHPEVSSLVIPTEMLNATHPVTQSLAERGRRLRGAFFRALERGRTPTGGAVLALVGTREDSWRDVPGLDNRPNWTFDEATEERGRMMIAASSEFPTSPTTETRARVVALGGLDFLGDTHFETNRDFALNLFNWLAARDFRVRVARRDPFEARIDLERGSERVWAERLALWYLPASSALLGLLFLWRRRR